MTKPADVQVPARPKGEDDQYYPLLAKISEERLWYTSDVVKMILGAEFRDGTRTASIKAIMDALGVPYPSKKLGKDSKQSFEAWWDDITLEDRMNGKSPNSYYPQAAWEAALKSQQVKNND